MKKHSIHITVILSVIALGFSGLTLQYDGIQAQTLYTPDPDSRIWIEGHSNVNRFTCKAEQYEGEARLGGEISVSEDLITGDGVFLEFRIPVQSFECGRSRMNRDLYEALQAEDHLYIRFEYKEAKNIKPDEDREDVFQLEVTGILTVAGTSREIVFDAEGFILDDMRLRAIGKKQIRMTDYNVDPPTAMLGMVRARDELIVHFDLYASPATDKNL